MLRIAIFGAGWAGERHVEAIRELGRKVSVACLVDSDREFLKAKAEALGVQKTYGRWQDALSDPDVDAVSICLPHALHCEVAIAAAAAGKHVLCEKPITTTVDDATRMIDASHRAGVRLYVAENVCHTPMSRCLREVVQTGRHIGEVVSASFVRGFRGVPYGYPGRRAWLSTPGLGGSGSWLLNGIHGVAQIRFVFGEVDTVYMLGHRAASFGRDDVEATMGGVLRMASGHPLSVLQTAEVRLKAPLGGIAIHGDEGSVLAGSDWYELHRKGEPVERVPYPEAVLSSYGEEFEAFADYVAGWSVGPTTGESERRSLAVIQAGYESAQSGQPVNIGERFGGIP